MDTLVTQCSYHTSRNTRTRKGPWGGNTCYRKYDAAMTQKSTTSVKQDQVAWLSYCLDYSHFLHSRPHPTNALCIAVWCVQVPQSRQVHKCLTTEAVDPVTSEIINGCLVSTHIYFNGSHLQFSQSVVLRWLSVVFISDPIAV